MRYEKEIELNPETERELRLQYEKEIEIIPDPEVQRKLNIEAKMKEIAKKTKNATSAYTFFFIEF